MSEGYRRLMARALITGCSTGIGRATAIELTKRGYSVVATARRPEALDDLDVAECLRLDVDDDASVAETVAAAGPVDVLVNNAGFEVAGPIERVPIAEVKRMFETNVFGALRMIQAVLPSMREQGGGTIVNLSSVAGRAVGPHASTYSASKWALEALSEGLHIEMGHFGVRAFIIEPGVIETNFASNIRRFGADDAPYDELQKLWDVAMDRLGRESAPGPEVVAATIAEAIESDGSRWRWPVGDDAQLICGARDSMDDATFEAAMRETLQFHW
jgi:NAD(P)-dependent dehydrogenase (short-subunit alcohol dehydrogenase family)